MKTTTQDQPIHGSPVTDEEMAQENARLLAQHTPGPWLVDATPAHAPCWFMIRHKSALCGALVPLATVHTTSGDTLANARLIAAAPELLAALIGLLEQADLGEVDAETAPLVESARAAIAKATGGDL